MKAPLTYSQACALLARYAVALQDRQCCGDEFQPEYIRALRACTDAMGVQLEGAMNIYIVIEHEAMESGTTETSVVGAYLSREKAEDCAKSKNGGRYMSWSVQEIAVVDTGSAHLDSLREFLRSRPQDRDAWISSVGGDLTTLSPEDRRYEEGYADGVIQAYGFILGQLDDIAAGHAPAISGSPLRRSGDA